MKKKSGPQLELRCKDAEIKRERETQDKDETAAAGTTGTNEEGLILNMHAEFE